LHTKDFRHERDQRTFCQDGAWVSREAR
jgi:hypothetical protein